jgi:hypothetical protein
MRFMSRPDSRRAAAGREKFVSHPWNRDHHESVRREHAHLAHDRGSERRTDFLPSPAEPLANCGGMIVAHLKDAAECPKLA